MRRAVIFDMDGIIVDSEPIQSLAFAEVLAEYGVRNAGEKIIHVPGLGSRENWEILKEKFGIEEDTNVLVGKRRRAYLRLLQDRLEPRPGLVELLGQLREEGYALALATSSTSSLDMVLDGLSIRERFDAVVGGAEVVSTKPDPEIFLRVAEKLGITPAECVAIEDAPAGVIAAKRAGMKCIAVPTSSTANDDFSAADRTVDSLEHIDADLVASILGRGSACEGLDRD